jgi:hypothetical protein
MSTISQLNSSLYFNSTNNYIYIQTGYNDCLKFSTPSDTVNFLSLNSLSGTTNVSNDTDLQAITSTITNLTAINITGVAGNITGAAGLVGIYGIQGNQGIQGFQGRQGFQGVQGVQGAQGFQSTQGIQGYMGGFQGNQGLQGSSLTVVNFAAGRIVTSINDNNRVLAHTGISFTGTLLTVGGNISATGVYIQSITNSTGVINTSQMINILSSANSNMFGSWVTTISGTSADQGWSVASDSSDNSYLTGTFTTPANIYNSDGTLYTTVIGSGSNDIVIVNYGSTGMGKWVSKISSASSDLGDSITVSGDGESFVTGNYVSPATIYNSDGSAYRTILGSGSNDCFLVKYGSTGMGGYVTKISGAGSDVGYGVAIDSSKNAYVTSNFGTLATVYNSDNTSFRTVSGSGTSNCLVVKYGTTGMGEWTTKIISANAVQPFDINVGNNNNTYVCGLFSNRCAVYNSDNTTYKTIVGQASNDCFIVAYGTTGMASWTTKITNTADSAAYGIATDSSNNVYVVGYINSNGTFYNSDDTIFKSESASSSDGYIIKYGPTGMASWLAMLRGTTSFDNSDYISIDEFDNLYITGRFTSGLNAFNSDDTLFKTINGSGSNDCFVLSYTSTGSGKYATKISGVGSDYGFGISSKSNKTYVTGLFTSPSTVYNSDGTSFRTISGSGSNDCFLVKYIEDNRFSLVDLTNTSSNNGKLINLLNPDPTIPATVNVQTTGGTIYDTRTFTNANAFVFYNGRWYPTKNF